METEKLLVLSTGHLPYKEYQDLDSDAFTVFRFIDHDYGCILVLAESTDDPETYKEIFDSTNEFFPKLCKIIEYANANGIKYINFDQDGEMYDEFEQFDW